MNLLTALASWRQMPARRRYLIVGAAVVGTAAYLIFDGLARLGTWFDDYALRVAIKGVYAHEWLVLPPTALLLLVWPSNPVWRALRWLPFVVVLGYLLKFEMHAHSWLAWPLMAGALGFAWFRANWYHVVIFRPRQALAQVRGRVRRRWKTALLAAAALPLVAWLLRIPWSSWLALGLLLLAAAALAQLLTWLRGGGILLAIYLRGDPRLVRYFDAVRHLRRPFGRGQGGSLLADWRLVGGRRQDPLVAEADARSLAPGWLIPLPFRAASLAGVRHLLRLLARRRPMPVLDSLFLEHFLDAFRDGVWCGYERLRYGDSLDEYLEATRRAAAGGAPPPEVCHPDKARRQRLRWLALTEALAETCAFDSGAPDHRSPDWLRAASLLSQAGEAQLAIIQDLRRCEARQRGRIPAETGLAIHFFNLAAACLERVLDPAWPSPPELTRIPQAANAFCAQLQGRRWADTPTAPESEKDQTEADQTPLRMALFWQYVLIARLHGSLGSEGDALRRWGDARARPMEDALMAQFRRSQPRWRLAAALTQATAFAALAIERGRGADAFVMLSHTVEALGETGASADPLAWLNRVLERESRAGLDSSRVRFLWGLAKEEDMERQQPGSDAWEKCRSEAADLYAGARSMRVWRLCARGEAVPVGRPPGPARPLPQAPTAPAGSGTITEL